MDITTMQMLDNVVGSILGCVVFLVTFYRGWIDLD